MFRALQALFTPSTTVVKKEQALAAVDESADVGVGVGAGLDDYEGILCGVQVYLIPGDKWRVLPMPRSPEEVVGKHIMMSFATIETAVTTTGKRQKTWMRRWYLGEVKAYKKERGAAFHVIAFPGSSSRARYKLHRKNYSCALSAEVGSWFSLEHV